MSAATVAMQLTRSDVVVYDDFDTSTYRSRISFANSGEIIFGAGNNVDPIRLTNLGSPAQDRDAVNKKYVDDNVRGLTMKEPVVVVSTSPGDIGVAYAAGQTVDGYTLQSGDRILLMGQTNATQNGVWTVRATGAPVRPADFATGAAASGVYVFVDKGTQYLDRSFICITDRGTDTVDTNPLQWVQYSARPTAMAGKALVVGAGNELDVNTDNVTVEVVGDTLQIKDSGVGTAKLAPAGVTTVKLADANVTTAKVADGAVTNSKLAPAAVTNATIADTTIANAKLVHDSVTVNTARGLGGGAEVDLGGSMTVTVDHAVVPDLAAANTFADVNTFAGTTAATSQSTGTVVIGGGLGVGGDVFCQNTFNMSDRRLKKDIMPLEDALQVIERLNGCTFRWNDLAGAERANQPAVGCIAQDVLAVAPLATNTSHGSDYYAVEYTKLIPYLIESVKTLKRSHDALDTELRAIKRQRT